MLRAVIFDWFGTLAHWEHGSVSNYAAVFTERGYKVDQRVIDRYHTRWDGVDHVEHSKSRDAYRAWTRHRLSELVNDCRIPELGHAQVVDALLESDYDAPIEAFPGTRPVLAELQSQGLSIGICSNWGWDLLPFLEATGIAPFVDVPITSARAGFRKPHPGIYEVTLAALGVPPADAVFVGDSWEPDVLGPISVGITSVHICRDLARPLPSLVNGAYRISALDQLLTLQPFMTRTPP